ncbi:MAG: DUF3085 domain-containing protein [Phycisphaeraceae bacterium]|nr:DUF3085 domain-containing protein [Phycisphaeraceae bacterium]
MPRLHFTDQTLVLRMVEAAVKGGKPLMLAHDHGLYLCHDDIKHEPPLPGGVSGCVCAFVNGCDPEMNPAAFEVARQLVGGDDFGIALPLGGMDDLLSDLKRGHRLAIAFGQRAVTILTQAPPTKQQPAPAARGRGAESPSTARNRSDNMSKSKKSTKKTAARKGGPATSKAIANARKEVEANLKAIAAADQENAHGKKRDERATSKDGAAPSERAVATTKPAKQAKAAKQPKTKKAKRTSALDAAAQVLAGAKEPMTAGALIDAMAKRDLWKSPGGKTPHATLYAALIREIKAKGKDARFRKTDRGLFIATNGKAG